MQSGNNASPGPDATAVVLAGGRSQRMGRDKAFVPWGETSLLGHVLHAVRAEFPAVFVSAGAAGGYAEFGVPVVPDLHGGGGPLAGIVAALAAVETPWLFAIACDMPYADVGVWRALAVHATADVDAVVPQTAGGLEPLCAFYHRRCLGPFQACLEAGRFAVHAAVREVRLVTVDAAAWQCADRRDAFLNLNTPADVAAARPVVEA